MNGTTTPLQRAQAVAARQHGAITRAQLREFGFSDDQIDRRIHGLLVPVVRGVFLVGGSPGTWRRTAMIAALSGPPGTVVSFVTSAALAGLCRPPVLPHVTIPRGRSGRRLVAKVHTGVVDPRDRTSIDGIPCTTVARTLADCASVLDRASLIELTDAALCDGKTSVDAVQATLDRLARAGRGRGRAGRALLLDVLAAWDGPIEPASPAEMRLFRQLGDWGYPTPERQVEIRDTDGVVVARADVGWPDRRIAIEYDSTRWHNPRHWGSDERRHETVEVCGWRLLHADKVDLRPGERALRDALWREWASRAA